MRALLLSTALSCLVALPALAGVGETYGTREPVACPDRSVPAEGPPSPDQAARYVACELEHEAGDQLYLVSNVKVQVASTPRPIDLNSDSAESPDVSKPVYDIRGSFRHYGCSRLDSYMATTFPGRACSYSDEVKATGLCYVNTFGEWHCTMSDPMRLRYDVDHVPPPS